MNDTGFEPPQTGGPQTGGPQTGGPAPWGEAEAPRPVREPVFNAPWPAIALTLAIAGGYGIQSRFAIEAVVGAWAFSPAALEAGRWTTLLSALFLHGGWAHALMNAAFALAFGAPVARFFGTGGRGAAVFFLFYLACGVLSSLGYAALHWGSAAWVVGASGAVSGLMGGAARLIAGRGRLGPILSRPVIGMGAAWVIVNLLIGLVAQGLVPGAESAQIAWEAHLAGFVAGVLTIGPLARLVAKR